jgi:tetratricopeptide (TPR) repeat protein
MPKQIDYSKICFVIMPFNKKVVDDNEVDFDSIYDKIFEPAISAVLLPAEEGGGYLIPKRTDKDYFTGDIATEMFLYLQYPRFAFVDITGLNANVFYELGVRHHANESSTAIFRQVNKQPPPFDISHIKAFPYEYEPVDKIKESKKLITKLLTDSLEYNRIDSPVQTALNSQKKMGAEQGQASSVDKLLIEATNAIRNDDFITAIEKYQKAIQQNETNPVLHQELGLLLKKEQRWKEAVASFKRAADLSPGYSEAWRELGIAQNKVFHLEKQDTANPTGEEALLKAIELSPKDFDALASLGGIYKRKKNYQEAAEMYGHSVEVSNGHPYPLLNAIILQVREKGPSSITGKQKLYLRQAEVPLKKQVTDNPPYNAPWSFFDLSTIALFTGRPEEAAQILENGLPYSEGWQIKTHYDTLALMEDQKADFLGLEKVLLYLKDFVD